MGNILSENLKGEWEIDNLTTFAIHFANFYHHLNVISVLVLEKVIEPCFTWIVEKKLINDGVFF